MKYRKHLEIFRTVGRIEYRYRQRFCAILDLVFTEGN